MRLSSNLRRFRWLVFTGWVLALIPAIYLVVTQSGHLTGGGFDVPGSQSLHVHDQLEARYPNQGTSPLALVAAPRADASYEDMNSAASFLQQVAKQAPDVAVVDNPAQPSPQPDRPYVVSLRLDSTTNASAISGEYLSAASVLGVVGLVLKDGPDALWYPVGFTAGYLALLLFVAAPLRRLGSYTIPDFAEARLRSPSIRLLAAAIVLVIGGFYLVPQLKGAGLALNVVVGSPYWVGVAVVAVIVAINVAIGGMRGIETGLFMTTGVLMGLLGASALAAR